MDSESISTKQRLCPCDPPGIQAASSSGGCSSPPLSHLLGRRSLPHKVCNCADGIKLKSYQRKRCPWDPPSIQAASSSGGCSSPPLSHLLSRRSLPHTFCNCVDGFNINFYHKHLGIHLASTQPQFQYCVDACRYQLLERRHSFWKCNYKHIPP